MNDLFPIAPSSPPALHLARQRLELAQKEYNEASEWEDESGETIPYHIELELQKATGEVTILEWKQVKGEL
jgi:hypothetical protein